MEVSENSRIKNLLDDTDYGAGTFTGVNSDAKVY
jgi:hypothetical protein